MTPHEYQVLEAMSIRFLMNRALSCDLCTFLLKQISSFEFKTNIFLTKLFILPRPLQTRRDAVSVGVNTVSVFLTQEGSGCHHPSPAMAAMMTTVTAAGAVVTAVMTTMVVMATATAARLTTAVPAFNITAVFTVRVADTAWKQI